MPCDSMPPQLTAGGGRPKPRKLKVARMMMASATWKVALTEIVPRVFGMMCRPMMRESPAASSPHGVDEFPAAQRQRLAADEAAPVRARRETRARRSRAARSGGTRSPGR